MGREAVSLCTWKGVTAQAKVLLESTDVIVRGAIRVTIPRDAISSIEVIGDVLSLSANSEYLRIELGRSQAEKWAEVLRKPPPTLASKLGVNASNKAYVIGSLDDITLSEAISSYRSDTIGDALLFVAIITAEHDLQVMNQIVRPYPKRHIWCVYPKGKDASISDSTVRTFMREHGFTDNKSCSISEAATATRYRFVST
jgi:hypothetical protein